MWTRSREPTHFRQPHTRCPAKSEVLREGGTGELFLVPSERKVLRFPNERVTQNVRRSSLRFPSQTQTCIIGPFSLRVQKTKSWKGEDHRVRTNASTLQTRHRNSGVRPQPGPPSQPFTEELPCRGRRLQALGRTWATARKLRTQTARELRSAQAARGSSLLHLASSSAQWGPRALEASGGPGVLSPPGPSSERPRLPAGAEGGQARKLRAASPGRTDRTRNGVPVGRPGTAATGPQIPGGSVPASRAHDHKLRLPEASGRAASASVLRDAFHRSGSPGEPSVLPRRRTEGAGPAALGQSGPRAGVSMVTAPPSHLRAAQTSAETSVRRLPAAAPGPGLPARPRRPQEGRTVRTTCRRQRTLRSSSGYRFWQATGENVFETVGDCGIR